VYTELLHDSLVVDLFKTTLRNTKMNVKLPLIITSASVAALMGATAQAATVGAAMDYTQDITVIDLGGFGLFAGTGAGEGSGSFDSNGELSVGSSVLTSIPAIGGPGVVVSSTLYSGSITGSTWSYSGTSQQTFVSCTGNATICGNITVGTALPTTGNALFSLDILTGGNWFTSSTIGFLAQLDVDHMLAAPSAVPVPAAAWLFGSALLGLAGVSRKRKA
jgi:hypothetical protein